MLISGTTIITKIIVSSQSFAALCFSPGLYLFFQKFQWTFLVMNMSNMTISPRSHQ